MPKIQNLLNVVYHYNLANNLANICSFTYLHSRHDISHHVFPGFVPRHISVPQVVLSRSFDDLRRQTEKEDHWHLVNKRLNSYIYFKNKIRFSQNKVTKKDIVRQNTFSYITKSFSQLELYKIQETGRAQFNYNIINTSKRPDKVFQIIHSTEKI